MTPTQPVVTLRRRYRFEAAHYLTAVPAGHKCANMHGHSYQVTIEVTGTVADGMLIDFDDLDVLVNQVIKPLDHTVLNARIDNPTVENVAPWIWHRLADGPLRAFGLRVSVGETDRAECLYEGAANA